MESKTLDSEENSIEQERYSYDDLSFFEGDFDVNIEDVIKGTFGNADAKQVNGRISPTKNTARSSVQWKPPVTFAREGISITSPELFLRPDLNNSNRITNELFQVTNRVRQSTDTETNDIFGLSDYNDTFEGLGSGKNKLNNDKIEKLVNELGMKRQNEEEIFELDDCMRTRIFKGRFKSHMDDDGVGVTDSSIDNYLNGLSSNSLDSRSQMFDDKENITPHSDMSKVAKKKSHNSLKKSGKVFFKNPRRQSNSKTGIPILKPITNLTNIDFKNIDGSVQSRLKPEISPKRICTPKHKIHGQPFKSSLKILHDGILNIYMVDSLTGLINDATQFGTELNASNCEGFPLPEDINEIVQIPTNDDLSNKKHKQKNHQKMAIIKAYHNKRFNRPSNLHSPDGRLGFYNKDEYDAYKSKLSQVMDTGVEVLNDTSSSSASEVDSPRSMRNNSKDNNGDAKRKVKWADQLEW